MRVISLAVSILVFPQLSFSVDAKYITLKDGVPIVAEYMIEFSTFSGAYFCVTQEEADALSAKLTASGHANTVKKMIHDKGEIDNIKAKKWINFDDIKKSGKVNGKPSSEDK